MSELGIEKQERVYELMVARAQSIVQLQSKQWTIGVINQVGHCVNRRCARATKSELCDQLSHAM